MADPLGAFAAWSRRYIAASAAERLELESEGGRWAAARRPIMKELIKDNPREALNHAVPMVVRQQLPTSVLVQLEKRVNQRGNVTVYQGMPPPGVVLAQGQTLTHRIAELAGLGSFNVHPAGPLKRPIQADAPDPNLINRRNAALNGIVIDREFAVNDSPMRVLEVGERPDVSKKQVAVCPISGIQTADAAKEMKSVTEAQADTVVETPEEVIYLCGGYHKIPLEEQLLYAEGSTGGPTVLTGGLPAPPTPAIGQLKVLYIPMTFQDQNANLPTESKCYEIMRNVADYYSKSSYGKLTTLTTVTPPVKLPKNEAWYVQRDSSNGGDVDGLGLEMSHAREEVKKLGFDYLDYDVTVLRLIGGPRATGGWGGGGNVWVYGDSVVVTAHEIGHTFGLAHANFWDTAGTSAIGPGSNQEYGDSYDVMGGGGVPTDHYNAAAKVQVKWLPQSYVQNIKTSGLYRLHAFDQQVLDPRNRYALNITKDSQRTYWGELRQLYTGSATRPWVDKGMILGWKYPSGSGSNIQLIDTTAGSPYGKDDAPVALGQTFADTEAGIYITTVNVSSTTPKYLDVLVNMGDFSANQAPTLALMASTTVVPLNGTVTFTATAEDADGDTLAYQWQHWGDTAVKIVSPNSPVITRTFNTAGSYVVSCTVSDMKGGSITRTTLITVGTGNNTFTIKGRVTNEGMGLPNVLLTANGINPTITDADGYYTIPNLAANTYSVTPALYGYTFSELFNNSITVGPGYSGADFDTDVLPSVSISALDASAAENLVGATAVYRLTRTGSTAVDLVVNVNPAAGTASAGDYALSPLLASGGGGFSTFTIPAGADMLDVILSPTNDASAEGPESVTFLLAAGAGYLVQPNAGSATVVIDDDDTVLPKVRIIASTSTSDEGTGAPGVLTVSRTGITTNDLVLNLSVAGTATPGMDYESLAGSVTIPSGSTSATVGVTPVNDTLVEPLETVTVSLSSHAAYLIDPTAATDTVSLFDDDTNVVSVTAVDATAQEVDLGVPENAANTGTFLVTRSGDTTFPLTVYYSVAGNPSTGVPALNGVDFETLAGVVLIPAGAASATISIIPRWDSFGETAEQVLLQLGAGPTDYRLDPAATNATVVINDGASGSAPYVEVTGTTSAVEAGSNGVFTFSLKGSQAGTVSIPFTLTGSATVTSDYTVTVPTTPAGSSFDAGTGTGVLVLNASTATANTGVVTIVPVNDVALEDIETVDCAISSSGAVSTFARTSSASIWLRDNDQPTVWVDSQVGTAAATISRITEDTVTSIFKFYVSRTGATSASLTVSFSLGGAAIPGTDYTVTTGATVTFDNATRSGTLVIPVAASGASLPLAWTGVADTLVEGMEPIVFHLEPGSYARTPDAVISIDDNDTAGGTSIAFSSGGTSGVESDTHVEVPVTLSTAAVSPVTVDYMLDTGARTSTTATNAAPALPYWTRVVRSGSSLSSYISGDGVVWKQVGSTQMVSMSSTSYTAGMVAMSGTSGIGCVATIDSLGITGLDLGGSASASASFGSIGTTSPASTGSELSGIYTLNAGGAGLSTSGTADTSCYASFAITNSANCTITARVVSIANGNATSRVGVTLRESSAIGSRHVTSLAEKSGTARMIYRATTSASAASSTTAMLRPYWVRLKRVADVFSAWSSVDGSAWVQTGANQSIPMGLDVQAGLAVCAKLEGSLATAVFDNVTVNGVAAAGLKGRTIGYVNAQGSDTNISGTYTVIGSGSQIGSSEDECHFVGTTITGDFEFIARVLSQTGGATTAQAGVMARENNSYRALSAYTGLVANALSEFVYRNTAVANSLGSGVDYSLASGTLIFAAGEQTKTIVLTVNNDSMPEPNEALTIKLLNPTGGYLAAPSSFTFVIDDDDEITALPYAGFALGSSSGMEAAAGTQQITVTLSAPATGAETVDYSLSGTATADEDYTLASGTVAFAAGEMVRSIPLSILDDGTQESAETVVVTLSNPVGVVLQSQKVHTFTINDDDLPVVSIIASDATATESPSDTGTFMISRTGPTVGALNVTLNRTGTATSGSDYAAITTPLTLTIPDGQSTVTLTVNPVNDTSNEGTETVIETIASNASYTIGTPTSATITLLDDDRPTVTIMAVDAEASETAGNTGTFTVTRGAPTNTALTVNLTIAGTAANTVDYATVAATVSFASGDVSKAITITPTNDTASEGDETVVLSLASGSYIIGGSGFAQGTILDNDYAPTVSITSPTASGVLVASGQGVVVSAAANDDGLPAVLTTTWSLASGSGAATIATPEELSTAVTFSADGVYVLKFTATDTQFTVSDQITVIVGSAISPAEWIAQDMSPTTQQRGQSSKAGTSYVLTGMGAGYSAVTADGAHLMTSQVAGDGSIVARLTTLGGAAAAPLAGVTIRDSLNRSCNRAVLGYSGGNLQFRTRTTASTTDTVTTLGGISLPVWVRLDRVSGTNAITAFYSTDGTSWNIVGSATAIPMLNELTQMGLTATGNSSTASQTCTATFDNVILTPAPAVAAVVTENFGTAPTTQATFAFNGTIYTIAAADGLDSGGAFYGWQYNGNVMVTAKLASATSGALSAHSGIMIRESMDSTAGYVQLGRCPTGSFNGYFWRSVAGGGSGGVPSFTGTVRWMRLVREGNKITAFHAPDSGGNPGTWAQLGSPRTIIMSPNVLVGFAVDNSGGTAGVLNTCTFSNLSVVPLNKSPTITLASVTSPVVSSVSLGGGVVDDNFPQPVALTSQWSVLNSPGISFLDALTPATTATITGDGLHSLRLSASDGSVLTFRDLAFTGYQSNFSQWQSSAFTSSGDPEAAPDADPDRDNLPNLLEYAVATSANSANGNPVASEIIAEGPAKFLCLSLPKNPAASDIVFTIEATSNLNDPLSWSSAGIQILENTSTLLRARDSVPVSSAGYRFMRVRVTRL